MISSPAGATRELKTMSSLRVPCACAGVTIPGDTCSARVSSAHRNVILLAHAMACDAILHRIIALPFVSRMNSYRRSGARRTC